MGREEDTREKNFIFCENISSRSSLSRGATALYSLDFCRKWNQNALLVQTWRDLTVPPAFLFLPHEGIWLSHPSWTLLWCCSYAIPTSWHTLRLEMTVNKAFKMPHPFPRATRQVESEQKPYNNSVGMNACSPCWCYITTWLVHLSELKVQVKLFLFTAVQDYWRVKVGTGTS